MSETDAAPARTSLDSPGVLIRHDTTGAWIWTPGASRILTDDSDDDDKKQQLIVPLVQWSDGTRLSLCIRQGHVPLARAPRPEDVDDTSACIEDGVKHEITAWWTTWTVQAGMDMWWVLEHIHEDTRKATEHAFQSSAVIEWVDHAPVAPQCWSCAWDAFRWMRAHGHMEKPEVHSHVRALHVSSTNVLQDQNVALAALKQDDEHGEGDENDEEDENDENDERDKEDEGDKSEDDDEDEDDDTDEDEDEENAFDDFADDDDGGDVEYDDDGGGGGYDDGEDV